MTRLPDKRKEKTDSELRRGTRLEPLPPCKSTRLPPLKSQRFPDITHSGHASDNLPSFPSTKPNTERQFKNHVKPESNAPITRHKPSTSYEHGLPSKNESFGKKLSSSKQKLFNDISVAKTSDVPVKEKFKAQINEDQLSTKLPCPPTAFKDSKTTPKQTYQATKDGKDIDASWEKERELLRRHRKQQAERRNASIKPLKATVKFDSSGKEMKPKPEAEFRGKRVVKSERKKIDLSVRRKCDDEDDWDWDKDIEEYMNIEENERSSQRPTSGKCALIQNGGRRENTPVILNCTKKGVGFKSKKRLEEERRNEQERIEKERKEKERIELMIPQKIRKDLKKYGFR